MNNDFKQQLGNLPPEILALPRFLRTRKDNPKAPTGADWQKPEKQKLYSELKGICGFVAATDTEESLIFFDFDHAIINGEFINDKAAYWFNLLTDNGKYFAELSQSTTGAHTFAKPTKGKFGKVTGKIYLTEDKKSFIEVFYRTTKFCLVTGATFRCKPHSPIAQGEVADNMFQAVIAALTAQNSPTERADSTKELLTTREVADFLGVTVSTVKNWRVRKLFGCYFFAADEKHGDTLYYKRERVEQLKAIYQRGILQNMYKLARKNPEPTPPDYFQKSDSSDEQTFGEEISFRHREFLIVDEVADYFGVTVRAVQQWVERGQLKEDMLGHNGDLYFAIDNVLEFTPPKSKNQQADKPTEQERAIAMLEKIPCAEQTYEDWVQVGMILKNTGNSLSDWENWSRADSRYKQGECADKWNGFKSGGLTIATLHDFARKLYGYSEHDFQRDWYQQHGTSHKIIRATELTDNEEHSRTRNRIKDCPVDLALPDNYIFGKAGITLVIPPKKDNDEPKYICAARTPIIPTKIFREPMKSKFSYEIAILTRGTWRTVEIDGRALADPRAIIALADTGALIDEPKILCRFLNAVIALNSDLTEITAYSQTGWTDDTFKTFAYPHSQEHIIRRTGFNFDRDLAKRGNAELWKEKFREVTETGGAIAALYIGTALAAIIARPLNIMNPQTHLCGKSGGGKTALQKFAASIFGNPRKLIRTFAATNKNRQLVSAAFCDLPTFYDELETLQGKAAEELLSTDIYNFAEGKGNQANKRDGTARETFEFGGARLTTGERPLLKNHDLRGAYKRLIQLCIQGQLFDDNFAADLHIFSESNFGHFGYQWIQYATEHFDEIQKHYQHYATDYNPTLKIFEPTHLKAITAALVAVESFKVMLGINAKFDEDCAFIRNRRKIVDDYLPTLADLDDTARALKALESYVASHEKTFARDIKDGDTDKQIEITSWGTVCNGKLFDSGAVAIFPTELKRILEDELHFASADKLINEWILNGTLHTDKGRRTKVIKFGEKTRRVYFFKAGAIACANDSEGHSQIAN